MSYGFEWMPAVVLVGAFVVLMVPAFALIGLAVVALAAIAALVALAGAIVASPYLLARTVRRRLAERHVSTRGSVPIAEITTFRAEPGGPADPLLLPFT